MIKDIVFDFNGVLLNTHNGKVDLELVKLIEDLYELGFGLYIFSNTSRDTIERYDTQCKFLNYFDELILCEEIGASKPSNEAFEKLLSIVGDSGEEIVYVDDGRDNLRQGNKYLMTSLLYINADRLRNSLISLDTFD